MKPEGLPNYHVEPPLDIFPVAKTQSTLNNGIESANVFETQNTDLIVELAIEVPENEREEYEDHHDDRTESARTL